MRDIIIAPSILAADYGHFYSEVRDVEAGGARYLHIDVMDGNFVPNISFGPGLVKSLRGASDAVFDVHLMVTDPERHVCAFAEAGADIITFHVEAAEDPAKTIAKIRAYGKKVGITLRPGTPVSALKPYLDLVDMVLIMSVEPGYGGQKFMPESLARIRQVKDLLAGRNADIEVDGGIVFENVGDIAQSGANVIVAGTCVFGAADRKAAIKTLLQNARHGASGI